MSILTQYWKDAVAVIGLVLALRTYVAARAKARAVELGILREQAMLAKATAGYAHQLLQSGSYKTARHLCSMLQDSCEYLRGRIAGHNYAGQDADQRLSSFTVKLRELTEHIEQMIHGGSAPSIEQRSTAITEMGRVCEGLSYLAAQLQRDR